MNVIVICLDTLRQDHLGCYGKNPGVRTPAIDRYAATATRFDMAFCASFPTVPMRVDAYTGDVNWPRYGWKGVDPDQKTFVEALRENGFYTGLVLDTMNNVGAGLHEFYDECRQIKTPPTNTVKREDIEFPVPRENLRQNGGGYAGDRARFAHFKDETDWYGARTMLEAGNWLEHNYRRGKFFLWVDTFEIHEDWYAPPYYTQMYDPDYRGRDYTYPNYGCTDIYQPAELEHLRRCYAAEVTFTDTWVGHLFQRLEYMGLFANSAVILLSDHGMYIGEHGRAGKHTVSSDDSWPLYDTVSQIPLLVWTPFANVPATTRALVQPADLYPTILELAGVKAAAPYGRSFVPVLKGETDKHHDRIYTSCFSWDGPGRIDYLTSLINVTTPEWTAEFGPRPYAPELYNRKDDPGQEHNIAAEHPEVVESLRRDLAEFMQTQRADPEYIRTYALAETGNKGISGV